MQTISVRRMGLLSGSFSGGHPRWSRRVRDQRSNQVQEQPAIGQFAAKANRIRVPVSRTRSAIFSSRSRMVENSPAGQRFGLRDGIAYRLHQSLHRSFVSSTG